MSAETHDPLLLAVVRLVEHGYTFTATVTVGGAVISGRIVSERRFMKGMRHQFNAQVHEENMPGLDEILSLFEDVSETSRRTYLHMEQAQVHDGTPRPHRPLGYWRIRMDDISGFSFGA
ncbi:MAG: hypothetical protein R2834_16935 [Rhodothermales bacterium]